MKRLLPILALPGVLLIVLAGLTIAAAVWPDRMERDWAPVAAASRLKSEKDLAEAFTLFQENLHAGTRSVAAAALGLLRKAPGDQGGPALFEALSRRGIDDFTFEYYDTADALVAWSGPEGLPLTAADIERAPRSFIRSGPIYSHLVVVLPVVVSGREAGRLVGKALFSVNHPVSNRLVSGGEGPESFREAAERAVGAGVTFRIPGHSGRSPETSLTPAVPAAGAGWAGDGSLVTFKGIAGDDIAYALLPRIDRSLAVEEARGSLERYRNTSAIALLLSLVVAAAWRLRGASGTIGYSAGLHGALWAVRYTMVWLDVPAGPDPWGLFDPSLFGSSFGYGAAKSPGDLILSALLLAWTLATFARISVAKAGSAALRPAPSVRGGAKRATAFLLGAAALAALLGPLTRGFHAVTRSVVFDSRMELNDAQSLYPDPAAALLLAGAALLVVALILGGMNFAAWARVLAGRAFPRGGPGRAWAITFLAAAAGSLLFDALHPNPLGSPFLRLAMTGGTVVLAWAAMRREELRGGGGAVAWPGTLLMVALVAVGTLVPALDDRIHEHDRALVEASVRDLARSEDAWMRVLLDRSLSTLADSEAAAVLAAGDAEAVGKLAFSAWAGSVLPGEGNTCSVTFVNLEGSVVSHFHVGPAPHWSRQVAMDEMPRSTRLIARETRTIAGRPTPWFKGYAPLFDSGDRFVGGVWVGIAPVDPARILGARQDLLTTSAKYGRRTPDREVIVSEYAGGSLESSSGDDFPLGRPLPTALRFDTLAGEGSWMTETIGGTEYETYYAPTPDGTALAVSLEALGAGWHFYRFSRAVLFFGSVLLACVVVRWVRFLFPWRGWRFSFRSKLIAAFAVVSAIPVVLLAWYNRQSLQQEAEQSTDAFLRSETELVLNEIGGRMGMPVPYELRRFADEALEDAAAKLNTEFHLYDRAWIHGSSRPDLIAAELIDRRMPAGIYRELFLAGRNFASAEQSVGSVRYLVGYRAIRAQSGEAIGAVGVPSLSRQEIVGADLARRDVILYGIYIVVLAVALLAGTGLARQIARPVGRLTAAARRVSTGDLDVRLETGRGDELGALETAFQGMTADLRRIQEKMVAVERELAWKEMARQVAHEIKNPLTPMRLSIQHLVSTYRKGAGGFGELLGSVSATVLEQIEALSRIASEFSSFGRLPERRVELCHVHAVIDEAAALYHREGVRFASAYVAGAPEVRADREELRRALINIFRNSVQAAAGAEVSIGVTTRYEGSRLVIAVSDDGPGMTPEVQRRLFEPNFSTKTDGMGIGLTIVKKTVEDLDGSIAVESVQGKGTTVLIRLPLAVADENDSVDA